LTQLEEIRAPGSSLSLVELAPPGELDLEIASRHSSGPSSYLKISDGCDQRCAFCAIPFMKGKPPQQARRADPARSRPIAWSKACAKWCWSGQDTTRYGHDLGQRDGLARSWSR